MKTLLKAIIEIGDGNNSLQLKRGRNIILFNDLSKEEQIKIVESLGSFYKLFLGAIK